MKIVNQSQNTLINTIAKHGTIGIHSLSSSSAMHVQEILTHMESLEKRGVVLVGSKGRKQTYTLAG